MNLSEIEQIAKAKMKEHGLDSWKFRFDNAKSRMGCCKYRYQMITVSKILAPTVKDDSLITNTILHEIAHALVGVSHGHDNVWRRKAIELGCNGSRCYDKSKVIIPYSWEGTCPSCGIVIHKHRKSRNGSACLNCCNEKNGGQYSSLYDFIWKRI